MNSDREYLSRSYFFSELYWMTSDFLSFITKVAWRFRIGFIVSYQNICYLLQIQINNSMANSQVSILDILRKELLIRRKVSLMVNQDIPLNNQGFLSLVFSNRDLMECRRQFPFICHLPKQLEAMMAAWKDSNSMMKVLEEPSFAKFIQSWW